MPRVKIQRGDVSVELDANEASHTDLADKAFQLFKDAGGCDQPRQGLGFAGSSADRRQTPDSPEFDTRGRRFGPVTA